MPKCYESVEINGRSLPKQPRLQVSKKALRCGSGGDQAAAGVLFDALKLSGVEVMYHGENPFGAAKDNCDKCRS